MFSTFSLAFAFSFSVSYKICLLSSAWSRRSSSFPPRTASHTLPSSCFIVCSTDANLASWIAFSFALSSLSFLPCPFVFPLLRLPSVDWSVCSLPRPFLYSLLPGQSVDWPSAIAWSPVWCILIEIDYNYIYLQQLLDALKTVFVYSLSFSIIVLRILCALLRVGK